MAALENVMGPVQSCKRTRSKGLEDSSRYVAPRAWQGMCENFFKFCVGFRG